MLFGTLITLGLGAYLFGSAVSDGAKVTESKNNAYRNDRPYYIDSKNRKRSMETNEILVENFQSMDHNGHHVLIGYSSRRVYHDYTAEAHKKANADLVNNGKKFLWKEYVNVYSPGSKASTWKCSFWPYDPEKQSAYLIERNRLSLIDRTDKMYIKKYIEPSNMPVARTMVPNKKYRDEYMTREELEPWYYVCRPSF